MADTPDFEEMYRELQETELKKADTAVRMQPVKKEKPADDNVSRFIRSFVTFGTPACGLLCAVIGLALAVLLMTVGFWKSVLIVLFCTVGAFIGGVFDKSQWLKNVINTLFPPKK